MGSQPTKHISLAIFFIMALISVAIQSEIAFADLQGSMINMKSQLSGVVLPLLSVCGLLWAAFAYLTGHPESKRYITYALIGTAVGFGAQSIIDFISSAIH